MNLSIPMALMDYVPVVLFLISVIILLKDMYGEFSQTTYSLFSAGGLMVFVSGFYKATWKLLMASGICNFEKLSQVFFPLQATGFLLLGIAMILYLCFPKKSGNAVYAAAPAVYSGTMLFVAGMVLGIGALCTGLSVLSFRKKRKSAGILYLIAFIFMLGMGYLSSKDFAQASMNWIAQGVNATGQALFLAGTWILHSANAKK